MNTATVVFALLLYAATLLGAAGLAWRIRDYARTPAPLKIPTTPAPTTTGGVVLRMLRELTLFESLFKANLWIWLFGWMFHVALALVLVRHLRYFTEPVWFWVVWLQPFGLYAGLAMAAGLARPVGAALSGRAHPLHLDPVGSSDAGAAPGHCHLGLVDEVSLPHRHRRCEGLRPRPDPVRLAAAACAFRSVFVHLFLVALPWWGSFPTPKLLHAPGVFFSPGTQSGRRSARAAPPRAMGGRAAKVEGLTWPPPRLPRRR